MVFAPALTVVAFLAVPSSRRFAWTRRLQTTNISPGPAIGPSAMLCPLSVLCPLTMLYSRESPSIGPATYGVGVESKASTSHPTVHTSQSYLLPVKARAALRYKVGLAYHVAMPLRPGVSTCTTRATRRRWTSDKCEVVHTLNRIQPELCRAFARTGAEGSV